MDRRRKFECESFILAAAPLAGIFVVLLALSGFDFSQLEGVAAVFMLGDWLRKERGNKPQV